MMAGEGVVRVETVDGVQTLRIHRPEKKNALTGPMYETMTEALSAGDWSDEVAVHLFLGREGIFTAGNDLGEFLAFAEDGALGVHVVRFLRALVETRKPMVAAVDGLAIGIGTTMLLHCDLVYASPAARFATPFLDLGLVPEAASSLLMPQRMGHAWAFEMLCLGETFDAEKAWTAGIVNAIVPSEGLEAHAMDAARRLAAKPAEALAEARRLLRQSTEAEVVARMEEETALFAERLASPEAREAFSAFLEKRPPDFAKLRRAPKPGA